MQPTQESQTDTETLIARTTGLKFDLKTHKYTTILFSFVIIVTFSHTGYDSIAHTQRDSQKHLNNQSLLLNNN